MPMNNPIAHWEFEYSYCDYLQDEMLGFAFDSEDEDTEDTGLHGVIIELTQQVRGITARIKTKLAEHKFNTHRIRLVQGNETGNESVASLTDCDIAKIAQEGLFEIPPGTMYYDCHDVHLGLVVMSVYDDEAQRQKLVDSVHQMDTATLEEVLKAGQDPNCVDDSGRTPAMIAAAHGYLDVLNLLWLAGADFRKVHEETQRTVLHFAAEVDDLEAAEFLAEQCDVDFEKRDLEGLLAHEVAYFKKNFGVQACFRKRKFEDVPDETDEAYSFDLWAQFLDLITWQLAN